MRFDSLLLDLPRIFPEVPKPDYEQMMEHGDECICCQLVWNDLIPLSHPIPDREVAWLRGEQQCLSPIGFRWFVPSLLDTALRTASEKIRHLNPTSST